MPKIEVLHLTPNGRGVTAELFAQTEPSGQRGAAHGIVLLWDEGASYREIEEQLGAFPSTI